MQVNSTKTFSSLGPQKSIPVLFRWSIACMNKGWKNILSHSTNEHIHLMYCLFVLPGLPVCCECLCPFVLINLLLQIKTSICWRSYLYLSSPLETWATLSHRVSARDMCHMTMLQNLFRRMAGISLRLCRFHHCRKREKALQRMMGKKCKTPANIPSS